VRLPPDFARTLELYGRWQFDPAGSGIQPSQIGGGNIEYKLYMLAQPDPDAFVRAVAGAASSAGGWALYGGERAIMNSVGYYPELTHPDYLTVLDAAIDFLHGQGYGAAYLPPYMMRRWADRDN
jgi:hypothetical protein